MKRFSELENEGMVEGWKAGSWEAESWEAEKTQRGAGRLSLCVLELNYSVY